MLIRNLLGGILPCHNAKQMQNRTILPLFFLLDIGIVREPAQSTTSILSLLLLASILLGLILVTILLCLMISILLCLMLVVLPITVLIWFFLHLLLHALLP